MEISRLFEVLRYAASGRFKLFPVFIGFYFEIELSERGRFQTNRAQTVRIAEQRKITSAFHRPSTTVIVHTIRADL